MTTRALFPLIFIGSLLLGLACASAPPPAPDGPESPPQAPIDPVDPVDPVDPIEPEQPEPTPEPEPEPEPAAVVEPIEEVEGAYGARTVVISSPEEEKAPESRTLAEAARLARERRAAEGAPTAVITDDNLSDYATGELSVVEDGGASAAAPSAAGEPEAAAAEEKGEAYWRDRVRTARQEWSDRVNEIGELESEVGTLRQRFYAEDDGFYRDSQIKPAWDRAIDRLRITRDEVDLARRKLANILEEGRQAGALPGWLREGIELEPLAPERREGPAEHQVAEPTIAPDPDDGP